MRRLLALLLLAAAPSLGRADGTDGPAAYLGKTQELGQTDYAFARSCVPPPALLKGEGDEVSRKNEALMMDYRTKLDAAFDHVAARRGDPLVGYDLRIQNLDDQKSQHEMYMASLLVDGGPDVVPFGEDGKLPPPTTKANLPEMKKAAYESSEKIVKMIEAQIATLKAKRAEKSGKKEAPLTYAGKKQEPGQSDYVFVTSCVKKGIYELGDERQNRETDDKYESDLKKAFEAVAKQRENPLKTFDLELLRKDEREAEARMVIASMEQQRDEFKNSDRPELKALVEVTPGFIKEYREKIVGLQRDVAAIKDARRKAKDALKMGTQ